MSQGKLWTMTVWAKAGVSSEEYEEYWSTVSWGVYGGGQCEISPNPGPGNDNPLHFQGFVLFASNKRLNTLVTECPFDPVYCKPAKFIRADGNLESQEKYCSKESTRAPGTHPITWGERPVRPGQGKRSDLDRATELIKNTPGNADEKMHAVAVQYPSVFVRNSRGLRELAEMTVVTNLPVPSLEEFFPWQTDLHAVLMGEPDDRTIHYVYDPQGKQGKSAFIRYFLKKYPFSAIAIDGKVADMAHATGGHRYVFIDMPRSKPDAINGSEWTPQHLYHFAEKLKNGFFFSGKYASRCKTFSIPHVVFMSNSPPVDGLWTGDRLNLIQLTQPPAFDANFNYPNL